AGPPTDETGGAGGLRGTGTTRAATAAGAPGAGAAAGAAGGGDGGASSTSLARSFAPAWRARRKATLAVPTRVATTEWARWDPTTAIIASVNSGMLMMKVARVTERDNSNPPCDLSRASGDSRPRLAARPSGQAPQKGASPGIRPKRPRRRAAG